MGKGRAKRRGDQKLEAVTAQPPTTTAPVSPRRKWIFRIAAVLLAPLLFFLLLEFVLLIAGVGYSTSYFVKSTISGQDAWVGNLKFSLRFFPPALARDLDRPIVPATKPPGTTRIFVLGSSAAQGDPAPRYSFARVLDVLLRERYPARRFEVVNTAITAINSNVILPIARDCARLDPDYFVLYLGNNEVIGPFGPATVFTPFAQRLTVMRAALAAKTTRTGQLIDAMLNGSKNAQAGAEWGGMTMFLGNRMHHSDPRMEIVYDHYRENLKDISAAGRSAGAKIIFCTLGVNLKDCAPFASLNKPGLPTADLERWKTLLEKGIAAESAGRFAEAVESFTAAAAIDNTFAELHFRLGRCHEALGRFDEAMKDYVNARDFDALPFRADSRQRDIVRELGAGHESENVYLADVARAFELASPHELTGENLFYEHVHMNFHGNYVAARAVLEQLARTLGDASGRELAEAECAERLALVEWDQLQILREVLSRLKMPPFTEQIDNGACVKRLESEINARQRFEQPDQISDAEKTWRRAIENRPDDWRLRETFGRFLLDAKHDAPGAAEQFEFVKNAAPFDFHAHHNLALALQESGKFEQAVAKYQDALKIKPDFPESLCGIALSLARLGRQSESVEYFAKALKGSRSDLAHLEMGRNAEAEGNFNEALDHFRQSRLSPQELAGAHNRIAVTLVKAGKGDEAMPIFQKALEIVPDFPEALSNAGNLLMRRKDLDAAQKYFEQALRLRPDLAQVNANMGSLLMNRGNMPAAIPYFEKALRAKPDLAIIHNSLGVALANQGRLEEATNHFAEALRLQPELHEARKNLESARLQLSRAGVPK